MEPDQKPATGLAPLWLVSGLALTASLSHLYFNTIGTVPDLWVAALHFGMFGALCFLRQPLVAPGAGLPSRLGYGLDLVLAVLALACAIYLIAAEDALYARGVRLSTLDWFFAITAVLLAIELTRRTTGWIVPGLIILSLSYVALWGPQIEGIFNFPGLSWETVLFRAYFSSDGMFGTIATISWSFVFMFILFGAFLVRSGAGDFIVGLAQSAASRATGGPGFVAVVSSGMMGSVSGSAIANTVATGVITIPLMRKSGFSPRFAAGVEAAASTGGQLMPPVMGAGAFIMANFTGVSYLTIIAAAFLPAVLYFLSVAYFVRIEAVRLDLKPTGQPEKPLFKSLLEGWPFLLPLAALVVLLMVGFTPVFAAAIAILIVIGASWLTPHPMGLQAIREALENGAYTMAGTAVLLVAIGIVVNVISTTGVGNTFSLMITNWAGGSLFVTLALVAIASLILGMGLPVTAAYVVLATLAAPAIQSLILDHQVVTAIAAGTTSDMLQAALFLTAPDLASKLGTPMSIDQATEIAAAIPADMNRLVAESVLPASLLAGTLLAAHLIIFWLSQDSNVTPPVCLTAFAAAGIAGSRPMETGLTAWKHAKGLYIIPLLMAYTPFIWGDGWDALWVFLPAIFGLAAAAGLLQGGFGKRVSAPWWGLYAVSAAALLWPHGYWPLTLLGVLILAAALYGPRFVTQTRTS